MGTEAIKIVVSTSGAAGARRDLEGIGTGAKAASGSVDGLATALKALVIGEAVREVIHLADSYTTLSNRLRFLTGSSRDAASVHDQLFAAASRTRTSIDVLGDSFSRITLAMRGMNVSQTEGLSLTEDFARAAQLSGASSDEQKRSLQQLAEGFDSGTLRGRHLLSVMQQTPLIAQIIAKGMGVATGSLIHLAEQGKITSQVVVDGFRKAHDELVVKFGDAVPTVTSAFEVLGNAANRVVGEINAATGASVSLTDNILGIAKGLQDMAPEMGKLAGALTSLAPFRGIFDEIFTIGAMQRWIEHMSIAIALLEDGVKFFTLSKDPSSTAAVLKIVEQERSARELRDFEAANKPRQGVTIVTHRDGVSTDKPILNTPPEAKFKRPHDFDAELKKLQRENELLQMGNNEREVSKQLEASILAIHAKVTPEQRGRLQNQIEENELLKITNESIDARLKDEIALMAHESERFSREAGERVTDQMNSAAKHHQLGETVGSQFDQTTQNMGREQLDKLENAGVTLGHIFGPGGTLEQGLGNIGGNMADLVGHAIAFGDSWGTTEQAVKKLGQTILADVISVMIQTGVQMAINAALSNTLRVGETAAVVTQAGIVGAAWAPAAAAASLATLGTNAVGASAALVSTNALSQTLAVPGFASGGFTGFGAANDVAGFVHGREFVVNAAATARNRPALEAMNAGARAGGMQVTIINQASGVEHEVRQVDEGHMEIVARRVLAAEGPGVIAADMMSTHGKTGRAMVASTTAQRRRS